MMRDKIRLWMRFRLNSGRIGALTVDSDVVMADVPSTPSPEHIKVVNQAAVATVSRHALAHAKKNVPIDPIPIGSSLEEGVRIVSRLVCRKPSMRHMQEE